MSICKSSPFSSRTKSLRERFGSKRSYSESFKDLPSTPPSLPDLSTHRPTCPTLPEQIRVASTGHLRLPTLPSEDFNPYAALSEETYCSALDINCQEGDPRFPWQRDVAVQCDLGSSSLGHHLKVKPERKKSSGFERILTASPTLCRRKNKESSKSSTVPPPSIIPTSVVVASASHSESDSAQEGSPKKEVKTFQKRRTMLQRAMSLERGRSRLVHQNSMDESRTAPNQRQLYVPHHIQTLTPSPEAQPSSEAASPTNKEASNHSAPSSRHATPPSDTPPQSPAARKPSTSERKKQCFLRKQTNSAPDSFEEPVLTPDRQTTTYFNFECMQRLLDLSMKVTSSQKGSGLDNRNFLLDIPTQSVPGKDGKVGSGGYLSLPSPNLQSEEHENSSVFNKLSAEDNESEADEVEEPPASALHRRRALVPPKMLTDGYESATDETDRCSTGHGPPSMLGDGTLPRTRRRSSIVVIPPMQICPGDLLVYSKVLTPRNNFLDLDGSTQCLAVTEDTSRKGKNTWSLLRLFDRSSRAKSDSLGGLEEVLSSLQPSEFNDEQLSRYKGMLWSEFLCQFEDRRRSQQPLLQQSTLCSSISSSSAWTPTSDITVSVDERLVSIPSEDSLDEEQQAWRKESMDTMSYQSSCSSSHNSRSWPRGEVKRQELMWDLFQSKCMFLYDHLMVLKNVFMEPLKKIQVEGFAMFAEPEVLFGNLDELCCVTYAFCKEFLSQILHTISSGEIDTTEILVKLFLKKQRMKFSCKIWTVGNPRWSVPHDKVSETLLGQSSKATALTQAYHRYTLNYINALNYLETLRRQVEFIEFEKWCSRDPRCKKLQLTDLLVSPVQHIMRVPLIIKEIEMRTEDSSEREMINSILEGEETSLRELDDKMKWLKNFERLLEIQRNIVWPPLSELDPKAFIPDFLKTMLAKQPCERLIVSPRRQIILEGPLQLLDSGKATEMYVLLFDDMLLITRRKKGLHKKKSSITENWASSCGRGGSFHNGMFKYVVYKQPLSLDRFIIHDISQQDGAANNLKNAFALVCLNRFQQIVTVHTFQAPSEAVKLTWLPKLRDTMDRWKRTLQNTVFRTHRLSNSSVK